MENWSATMKFKKYIDFRMHLMQYMSEGHSYEVFKMSCLGQSTPPVLQHWNLRMPGCHMSIKIGSSCPCKIGCIGLSRLYTWNSDGLSSWGVNISPALARSCGHKMQDVPVIKVWWTVPRLSISSPSLATADPQEWTWIIFLIDTFTFQWIRQITGARSCILVGEILERQMKWKHCREITMKKLTPIPMQIPKPCLCI